MSIPQRILLRTGCHPLNNAVTPPYGYQPSFMAGILIAILFCLLMAIHVLQSIRSRTWWALVFALGCLSMLNFLIQKPFVLMRGNLLSPPAEVLGWAARTWSAQCPYNRTAFLMQISTLILAPTFIAAGLYIVLGCCIRIKGSQSSILSPRSYFHIFLGCDCISLLLQAIGGGMASAEMIKEHGDTSQGTHIMLAGIGFQLFSMTVFVACAVDFVARSMGKDLWRGFGGPLGLVLGAASMATLCLYIRCIYRAIELFQGWKGYLITHEVYFIALDAAMVAASAEVFIVIQPGPSLASARGTHE